MLALDLARADAPGALGAKEKERRVVLPPSPSHGSTEEVLEHFSKALRDALSEDNHAKTLQLCKLAKNLPKANYDVFIDLILEFFAVNSQHVQLTVHAIEDELTAQKSGIILREESVASELLTRIFFREDGLAYLQRAVLPTIKRIYNNRNCMKTDLTPDDPGNDPEANLQIVFFYCRTIVNQLIATVNFFPTQLVSILRVLQGSAAQMPAYAESAKTVVSSLLFLRYICPTIVQPRIAGVQEDLSAAATLALVQVAKILQCGANHTHWNPEKPFAALIDRFLDTELNPLVDSLSQEILVKSRSYYSTVPQNSKPGVSSRALSRLVVYLGTNTDLYEGVEEVRSIMAGYILWLEASADGPLDSPPSPSLAPSPPDFPSPRRAPPALAASPRLQLDDPRLIPLSRPLAAPLSAKAKLTGLSRASSVAITAAEKKQGPAVVQNKFFDALAPPASPPRAPASAPSTPPLSRAANHSQLQPPHRRGSLDGFVPPPPSASSLLLDALPAAPVTQLSGRAPLPHQSTLRMSENSIARATRHLASMVAHSDAPAAGALRVSGSMSAPLALSSSSSMPTLPSLLQPIPTAASASPPGSGDSSPADPSSAERLPASTAAPATGSAALDIPRNNSANTSASASSASSTPTSASSALSDSPKRAERRDKDKKDKHRSTSRERRRSPGHGRDSRDAVVVATEAKEAKEAEEHGARERRDKERRDKAERKARKEKKKQRSASREPADRLADRPALHPPAPRTRRHSFDALSGMVVMHGQLYPAAAAGAPATALPVDDRPAPRRAVGAEPAKEARMSRQLVTKGKEDGLVVVVNPLRRDLARPPHDPDAAAPAATTTDSPRRPPSGLLSKLFPRKPADADDLRLASLPRAPSNEAPGRPRSFRKAQFAEADAVVQAAPAAGAVTGSSSASLSPPPQPDAPSAKNKRRSLSQPLAPPMLPLKKVASNPAVAAGVEEVRQLVGTANRQIVREVGIVGPPLTVHQPLPMVYVTSWICAREVVHFATLPRCLLSILFLDGAASLGALSLKPETELVQAALGDDEFSHRALVRVFSAAPQAGESMSEEASKQLVRRFHWWCLAASHVPGHNEAAGRPFNPDLLPEIIALFVYVHYINRVMLAVFGRKTWVQDWLATLVRPAMRSSRRSDSRRAGESLLLVPGRQAPPSVQAWASHSPILGRVYAVFSGALRDAALAYVPEAQLAAFTARVQRWSGAPQPPTEADVDADCGVEGAAVRAAYALMLRVAFEPAQAHGERRAFREHHASSAALLAVAGHAAMQAALHLGALAA